MHQMHKGRGWQSMLIGKNTRNNKLVIAKTDPVLLVVYKYHQRPEIRADSLLTSSGV